MGRSFGSSDTSLSVTGGLVCDRHLAEVAPNHIKLDFDVHEGFAVVNSNVVADHFGHDDSVAEVSLDHSGFLSGLSVFLGLLTFVVEADVFMLNFWIGTAVLREKRLLILALNSSTTCS